VSKLLSIWLAWRAVRRITAVIVVLGALAVLTRGPQVSAQHGNGSLNQLRDAVHPVEQQLERTSERAFKQ
jgi:hypothetical protein